MGEIKLKGLKFPNLESVYVVPNIDGSLTVDGAAADAKTVGDRFDDLNVYIVEDPNADGNVIMKNTVLSESDIKIDKSLTVEGAAADAKEVGDRFEELNTYVAIDENTDGCVELREFIPETDFIEVDKSLTTEGAAADSKAVGEHVRNTNNPHEVTAEQIGVTYNDRNGYSVASDEDIISILNAQYALTPDGGRRNFVIVDNVSTSLGGGSWQVTLYRADGNYGCAEAIRYGSSSDNGFVKKSRNFYNGNWSEAWANEDFNTLKIDDVGNRHEANLDIYGGWYRLATIGPATMGMTGSFLLSLGGSYYHVDPTSAVILIETKYVGGAMQLLGKAGGTSNFNELRLHSVPGSTHLYYIDGCFGLNIPLNTSTYNITPLLGRVIKNNKHEYIEDISGYSCVASLTL